MLPLILFAKLLETSIKFWLSSEEETTVEAIDPFQMTHTSMSNNIWGVSQPSYDGDVHMDESLPLLIFLVDTISFSLAKNSNLQYV